MPNREIKFSKAERKLRGLLPLSGRRVTTEELTKRFFAPILPPLNGRVRITNLLRSIKRKTELMNAQPGHRRVRPICSTEGSGRATHEVWFERSGRAEQPENLDGLSNETCLSG